MLDELKDEFLVGTYSSMSYAKKIISDELAKIMSCGKGHCGLADDIEIYTSWGKDILKYAKVLYPGRIGITDDYIDVLVNNAGIVDDEIMLLMEPEKWHRVVDVNLNSFFYCTRRVIEGMVINHHGRIVNISSRHI